MSLIPLLILDFLEVAYFVFPVHFGVVVEIRFNPCIFILFINIVSPIKDMLKIFFYVKNNLHKVANYYNVFLINKSSFISPRL